MRRETVTVRGRGAITLVAALLIAGCAASPFGGDQFSGPCKETQITGTIRMGLSAVSIVSDRGVIYELRETDDCRYECPKPAGKVPYVTIGNEPKVLAYFPIGDQFVYAVRGCLDDSQPGHRIVYARFVSCRKR